MKQVMTRGSAGFKTVAFLSAAVFICALIAAELFRVRHSDATVFDLPSPTALLPMSEHYSQPVLTGLRLDARNPLHIEFIVQTGSEPDIDRETAARLIRYFLAGLTVAEKDVWVNLSPYEQDRIVHEPLAETDLGKDLLAQDYVLKQLSASLTHPESPTGKEYWQQTYERLLRQTDGTAVPVNTFNKVWIMPAVAEVYENNNLALITGARMKVMLEADYLAMREHAAQTDDDARVAVDEEMTGGEVSSQTMRELILPQIETDINEGRNFATLRQIYHSLVLATWFKQKFRQSLYAAYMNREKMDGIDLVDSTVRDRIFNLYVEAFQKGVYNFIRKEVEPGSRRSIKRHYFSGGYTNEVMSSALTTSSTLGAQKQQAILSEKFKVIDTGMMLRKDGVSFDAGSAIVKKVLTGVSMALALLGAQKTAAQTPGSDMSRPSVTTPSRNDSLTALKSELAQAEKELEALKQDKSSLGQAFLQELVGENIKDQQKKIDDLRVRIANIERQGSPSADTIPVEEIGETQVVPMNMPDVGMDMPVETRTQEQIRIEQELETVGDSIYALKAQPLTTDTKIRILELEQRLDGLRQERSRLTTRFVSADTAAQPQAPVLPVYEDIAELIGLGQLVEAAELVDQLRADAEPESDQAQYYTRVQQVLLGAARLRGNEAALMSGFTNRLMREAERAQAFADVKTRQTYIWAIVMQNQVDLMGMYAERGSGAFTYLDAQKQAAMDSLSQTIGRLTGQLARQLRGDRPSDQDPVSGDSLGDLNDSLSNLVNTTLPFLRNRAQALRDSGTIKYEAAQDSLDNAKWEEARQYWVEKMEEWDPAQLPAIEEQIRGIEAIIASIKQVVANDSLTAEQRRDLLLENTDKMIALGWEGLYGKEEARRRLDQARRVAEDLTAAGSKRELVLVPESLIELSRDFLGGKGERQLDKVLLDRLARSLVDFEDKLPDDAVKFSYEELAAVIVSDVGSWRPELAVDGLYLNGSVNYLNVFNAAGFSLDAGLHGGMALNPQLPHTGRLNLNLTQQGRMHELWLNGTYGLRYLDAPSADMLADGNLRFLDQVIGVGWGGALALPVGYDVNRIVADQEAIKEMEAENRGFQQRMDANERGLTSEEIVRLDAARKDVPGLRGQADDLLAKLRSLNNDIALANMRIEKDKQEYETSKERKLYEKIEREISDNKDRAALHADLKDRYDQALKDLKTAQDVVDTLAGLSPQDQVTYQNNRREIWGRKLLIAAHKSTMFRIAYNSYVEGLIRNFRGNAGIDQQKQQAQMHALNLQFGLVRTLAFEADLAWASVAADASMPGWSRVMKEFAKDTLVSRFLYPEYAAFDGNIRVRKDMFSLRGGLNWTGKDGQKLSAFIKAEDTVRDNEMDVYGIQLAGEISLFNGDRSEAINDVRMRVALEAMKNGEFALGYKIDLGNERFRFLSGLEFIREAGVNGGRMDMGAKWLKANDVVADVNAHVGWVNGFMFGANASFGIPGFRAKKADSKGDTWLSVLDSVKTDPVVDPAEKIRQSLADHNGPAGYLESDARLMTVDELRQSLGGLFSGPAGEYMIMNADGKMQKIVLGKAGQNLLERLQDTDVMIRWSAEGNNPVEFVSETEFIKGVENGTYQVETVRNDVDGTWEIRGVGCNVQLPGSVLERAKIIEAGGASTREGRRIDGYMVGNRLGQVIEELTTDRLASMVPLIRISGKSFVVNIDGKDMPLGLSQAGRDLVLGQKAEKVLQDVKKKVGFLFNIDKYIESNPDLGMDRKAVRRLIETQYRVTPDKDLPVIRIQGKKSGSSLSSYGGIDMDMAGLVKTAAGSSSVVMSMAGLDEIDGLTFRIRDISEVSGGVLLSSAK